MRAPPFSEDPVSPAAGCHVAQAGADARYFWSRADPGRVLLAAAWEWVSEQTLQFLIGGAQSSAGPSLCRGRPASPSPAGGEGGGAGEGTRARPQGGNGHLWQVPLPEAQVSLEGCSDRRAVSPALAQLLPGRPPFLPGKEEAAETFPPADPGAADLHMICMSMHADFIKAPNKIPANKIRAECPAASPRMSPPPAPRARTLHAWALPRCFPRRLLCSEVGLPPHQRPEGEGQAR